MSTFSNAALERLAPFSILICMIFVVLMLARIFVIRSPRATWLFAWSDTSWRGIKILWTGSGKEKKIFFFNCFQVVFCLYTREAEAVYKERVHIMFPVET